MPEIDLSDFKDMFRKQVEAKWQIEDVVVDGEPFQQFSLRNKEGLVLQVYRVKMYHEMNTCGNAGKAFNVLVETDNTESNKHKPDIRLITESCDHGFWKGDNCKDCGVLAKVSIVPPPPEPRQ